MKAARQVFDDIRPRLKLAENPPDENFAGPFGVKRYLTKNQLMSRVLVVADGKTVKDAYNKLRSPRKVEYQELLETAAKEACKN